MKKRSLLILLAVLTLLLAVSACQKQSSPSLGIEYGRDDLERVEECKKVSFVKQMLYYENTLSLFKCLKWDVEFPVLFTSISKVRRDNWNHIMAPISDVILDNLVVRDRLIALVKRLDERNALDDLSRVITALNDTNFFDGLNELFICARENNVECTRKTQALSKEQIKNLLNILTVEAPTIDALHDLFVFVIDNFIDGADSFKNEVRKFYKDPVFEQRRVDLITVLSNILIENQEFERDQAFMHDLLTVKDENSGKLKITQTLEDDNFDLSAYKNLIHFPLAENLKLDRDFKVIKKLKSESIKCNGYENLAAIQLGPNLEQTLQNQVMLPKDQFFRALLDLGMVVKTASSFCDDLRDLRREILIREIQNGTVVAVKDPPTVHPINLIKFLKDYGRYLGDSSTFDLVKLLIEVALKNPKIGSMYLIDIASSDAVSAILRLTKIIADSKADVDSHIFTIMKNVREPQTNNASLLSEKFFEQKLILVELAKLWGFYSFEEKNIIFHYLDKHFEEDVNYVELIKFYLDAFSITKDLYPSIASAWLSDDQKHEASYLAVEDLVSNLSGHEALKDFKKLLSRDYILRIIEILSKGITQDSNALAGLHTISNSPTNATTALSLRQALSQNSENVYLNCLLDLEDSNQSVWKYLQDPPTTCKTVLSPPPIVATINLLAEIDKMHTTSIGHMTAPNSAPCHLFDSHGMFSNSNINSAVVLMDLLDEILRDQKNGISELFETLKYYYFGFQFSNGLTLETVLKKSLSNFVEVLDKVPEVGLSMRKGIARYLIDLHRDQRLASFFSNFGIILHEYAGHVAPAPTKAKEFNFLCRNELNQSLGENPCPAPSVIKAELNKSLGMLVLKHHSSTPTALSLLLKSIIPQEGLIIPYEGKNKKRSWITLKETINIMYEMSDRSYTKMINGRLDKSNQRSMIYLEKDKKKEENEIPKTVTTAERIETVIRDIRFDHNYLGSHYKNAVAKADDYNKTVNIKYDLMKFCVGLGFCGKFFTKDEKRMAKNSIASYPSLLESNTIFGRGNWMQTLLQIFVASSDPAAQKSALVKFGSFEVPMLQSKEQLQKHNGQVVTSLSMLAIFSNGGRYFRDRIGKFKDLSENKTEFYNYLNGREMAAINQSFLDHVNIGVSTTSIDKMLKAFLGKKSLDGRNLIEVGVDWFVSLKDTDLVAVEKALYKLLYLTAFIGTPNDIKARFKLQKLKSSKASVDQLNEHFRNNNLTNIFYLLGELADKWPTIYKASGNAKLLDFLIENDDLLTMFIDGLEKDMENLSENPYYTTLNEMFRFLEKLSDHSGVNIAEIINVNLSDQAKAEEYFTTIRQIYAFVNELRSGKQGKERMRDIGDTIVKLVNVHKFDLSPITAYLDRVAPFNATAAEVAANFHYDEPFKVIKILIQNEYFYYQKLTTHILKTFFEDLKKSLKEMFASIFVLSKR